MTARKKHKYNKTQTQNDIIQPQIMPLGRRRRRTFVLSYINQGLSTSEKNLT